MKLLLSSDALPAAPLNVLREAVARRALAGLELTVGRNQGHHLDNAVCPLHDGEQPPLADATEGVVWFNAVHVTSASALAAWGPAAHSVGAGIVFSAKVSEIPAATHAALAHGSDLQHVNEVVARAADLGAGTCWAVHPDKIDGSSVGAILDATFPTLKHVRLAGSGPEGEDGHEVVGDVLAGLALRGYAGTIALIPTNDDQLARWERWLLVTRGWGCGTAAAKAAKREERLRQLSETT